MSRHRSIWRILVVLVVARSMLIASLAVAEPETPLVPEQFARAVTFTPADDAPLQTLLVPNDVYHTVMRRDLGDLAVFNGDDEPVPSALLTRDDATPVESSSIELPLFPLRGARERGVDAVELRVNRDPISGAVTVARTEITSDDAPVVGYLLTIGDVPRRLRSLELATRAADNGFVARITVEASTDLEHWRPVARGSIARLDHQGQTLSRQRIELGGAYEGYLRLSWKGVADSFEITAVRATLESSRPEPTRQRSTVATTVDDERPGSFAFDIGGPIPIDRITVSLPQSNTLVAAELQSARDADGPWTQRFAGRLYRVAWQGEELSNSPLEVTASRDRYWRLSVDGASGGIGQRSPTIEVAWLPEQVLFVARGPAPFRVAYGSASAEPKPWTAERITAIVPGLKVADLAEQSGQLSAPIELSGDAALRPPPTPTPWKTIALWATLLLGVALLGAMTIRLWRQLG